MRARFSPIIFSFLLVLSGCVAKQPPTLPRNSPLSQGNVQLHVQVGSTTKEEILQNFGAPNVTTRDQSGKEVWSYQRSRQVAQANVQSKYWTGLVVGQSSGSSGFETSSRMVTLIITFDKFDIVSDFKSRESNF